MSRTKPSDLIAPPERQLFGLLEEAAANAVRTADLLDEFVHHHPDRMEIGAAVLVCEREGDRLTHEIARPLNDSFVAPIEPQELRALAGAIDDVVDLVEEIIDLAAPYRIRSMRYEARRLTPLLLEATRQLDAATPKLRRMSDYSAQTSAVARLEREGDQLLRQAIASLFADERDPLEVIRWKDLFERLESAMDACRRVATLLEAISIRYG